MNVLANYPSDENSIQRLFDLCLDMLTPDHAAACDAIESITKAYSQEGLSDWPRLLTLSLRLHDLAFLLPRVLEPVRDELLSIAGQICLRCNVALNDLRQPRPLPPQTQQGAFS